MMATATTRCRPHGHTVLIAGLIILSAGASLAPYAAAQVRGISYTMAPLAERVYFDRNAGLENSFLYGGELGFGFGRYVELQALYLFNSDLQTDFSRLTGLEDATRDRLDDLGRRTIALQRYGGKLKLNLPRSAAVPFLTLGAGLVRFEPDSLNSSRTIYLSAGAGIQFTVGSRYALTLGAENIMYRYNLGAAFFSEADLETVGLAPTSFNAVQVNNWAARAGLLVYLGGREPGAETELDAAFRRQFEGGLRGLSLRVEPFAGSVSFNEALTFRDQQRMIGLFAGLNFGPYVGVRGFYWRGVEDESFLFDVDKLQAFGGEMRFRLGASTALTPFLTFGGGYLDVLSGYEGRTETRPESTPFIIGGLGVVLPIGTSLSLNGGVRTLLINDEGIDNLNDPSDVYGSWMYSAGLTVSFGGPDRTAGDIVESRLAEARADAATREEQLQASLAQAQARLDSLAYVVEYLQTGDTLALARLREQAAQARAAEAARDTVAAETEALTAPVGEPTRRPAGEQQFVTLPVPAQGELYVRFGEPGGVSIESLYGSGGTYVLDTTAARTAPAQAAAQPPVQQPLSAEQIQQIVRETLREQLRAVETPAAANQQRLDRLEASLADRLDAIEDRLQNRIDRALSDLRTTPAPSTTVVVPERDVTVRDGVVDDADVVVVDRRRIYDPTRIMPFVAFMYGEPILFTIGVRGDLFRTFLRPIRLQPEFALGLSGDNYAYHLNLDAVYAVPFFERAVDGLRPYAGLGVGMLGFDEAPADESGVQLTFNIRLGTEFNFRSGRFFAEYATFDFFEYNRYALGYRVGI